MSRPTSSLTPDRLRRDGEAFTAAVAREWWMAHAGHAPEAKLQAVYDRYAHLMGGEALDVALDMFRTYGAGSEAHRQARALLEWQVESQTGRAVAELDEREIAWSRTAMLVLPWGESVPYEQAPIVIANTDDRRRRLAIDEARAVLVARELAPLRREKFAREHEVIAALGLASGSVETFAVVSGIDVRALATAAQAFLAETAAMWEALFDEFVVRGGGITADSATRADALYLLRGHAFDAHFPAAAMEPEILRQVREMGLDPLAEGRIRLDTGDRPGKRSRAFCAPVRVPDEVHLVLRPHGGAADWRTFLHELGHALHFAHMTPGTAFEDRWLGDNSITEGLAMLFDHRLHDRGWLARYVQMPKRVIAEWRRAAAFEELQFLRRYCAKLAYELVLHGGEAGWDDLPGVYADMLGAATGFRYQPADALVDVDPRFYCVRYLRAWQLQAQLDSALTERFDDDWWRNPAAGPWLAAEVLAHGQRELGHELAHRVAGAPLTFAPLVQHLHAMVA
ncbi:MAG: hypothetical protein MUF53_07240 [Gemmatimonadaceae bacterium]|nr:hypothetical protein [Gemmatimonadaceae bacterium]